MRGEEEMRESQIVNVKREKEIRWVDRWLIRVWVMEITVWSFGPLMMMFGLLKRVKSKCDRRLMFMK